MVLNYLVYASSSYVVDIQFDGSTEYYFNDKVYALGLKSRGYMNGNKVSLSSEDSWEKVLRATYYMRS